MVHRGPTRPGDADRASRVAIVKCQNSDPNYDEATNLRDLCGTRPKKSRRQSGLLLEEFAECANGRGQPIQERSAGRAGNAGEGSLIN